MTKLLTGNAYQRRALRLGGQGGFTLIELMIVLVIIAILAAIAIPAYNTHVLRAKVNEGVAGLAQMQAQMEQYFQDYRTYAANPSGNTSDGILPPCAKSPSVVVGTFTLTCDPDNPPDANTFHVLATGSGVTASFTYAIDQMGTRSTVSLPTDWGSACTTAWILKAGQACPSN